MRKGDQLEGGRVKRLMRLISPTSKADVREDHPYRKDIERAALRMLAKSGMGGQVRLWPNLHQEHGKPALLINVDKATRRFSQVALGLLGDYFVTYVVDHHGLALEGVFWSIHPEADMPAELFSCGPTTIGYLVEETDDLLVAEGHTLDRLTAMSDEIQQVIQGSLDGAFARRG